MKTEITIKDLLQYRGTKYMWNVMCYVHIAELREEHNGINKEKEFLLEVISTARLNEEFRKYNEKVLEFLL